MNLKKTKEVEKLQFVERMRYKKTYKNNQQGRWFYNKTVCLLLCQQRLFQRGIQKTYSIQAQMAKVPIWAYYCMNSYVTSRARSTRVLQYCHFDNFVLLTSSRLDGVTSPYPRENIIAGNYILADTQAFLSKHHRQQNKKILIRHSPGMGECFFVFKYSINRKN